MNGSTKILIGAGVALGVTVTAVLTMWGNIALAYAIIPFVEGEGDIYGNGPAFGRTMIVFGLVIAEIIGVALGVVAIESLPDKDDKKDLRSR